MWWTAEQAAGHLGVKRKTLYTYVSRGWIRTQSGGGRTKSYHAGDVNQLARRAASHAGRAPRAAGALRWGEPVLTTDVGAIDADGPYYRGVPALDLLDALHAEVCELLWQTDATAWPTPSAAPASTLFELRREVDALAAADPNRSTWTGFDRAAHLVSHLRSAARLPDAPIVETALVLCADHGLNASTFTARVVASTGADLYACLSAALAALSGPRHGTASQTIDHLVRHPTQRSIAQSRGVLPGFGHPLYPAGDPRAEALLERAPATGPLADLIAFAADLGLRPNLDVGLLAVCDALGQPATLAPRVFAIGRLAGWIAHIDEQRQRPELLRPRSTYAGWEAP